MLLWTKTWGALLHICFFLYLHRSFYPGVCSQRGSHTHNQFSGPCRCGSSHRCCLCTHSGLQRQSGSRGKGRDGREETVKKIKQRVEHCSNKFQQVFRQNNFGNRRTRWTGRQSHWLVCMDSFNHPASKDIFVLSSMSVYINNSISSLFFSLLTEQIGLSHPSFPFCISFCASIYPFCLSTTLQGVKRDLCRKLKLVLHYRFTLKI